MSASEKNRTDQTSQADKKKYAGLFGLTLFIVAVGIYVGLVVGWMVFPQILYSKQDQPIDFDHTAHVLAVENRQNCATCHNAKPEGSFAGITRLDNCAACHAFDHAAHEVEDCFACHAETEYGDIDEAAFLFDVEENCSTCHKNELANHPNKQSSCNACHQFKEDGSFSGIPAIDNCAVCHAFDHAIHEAEDCFACHAETEYGEIDEAAFLFDISTGCAMCHADSRGNHPDEVKLREEYLNKGEEIPWLVYARQPACVFFSHAAHVFSDTFPHTQGIENGADCFTCHGPLTLQDMGEKHTYPIEKAFNLILGKKDDDAGYPRYLRPFEKNRLTGYSRDIWGQNMFPTRNNWWDRMKMTDCAACHKEYKPELQGTVNEACFVCHK
jgi:hypothetical protein